MNGKGKEGYLGEQQVGEQESDVLKAHENSWKSEGETKVVGCTKKRGDDRKWKMRLCTTKEGCPEKTDTGLFLYKAQHFPVPKIPVSSKFWRLSRNNTESREDPEVVQSRKMEENNTEKESNPNLMGPE